ncbi:type VI secretion system membrane subunit TssM [Rosenbergiella australiborealis]|uniref:Type VI secretion system membrane subunit TssM n=2 Tax=Rosenbergiella TaxID=1356488 RepID=A0ABS5T6M7_9GAMM|nr:type VI secretion system membrane subunit TssM [Rosenbergiella australiborealis]MBT0728018.1 type VI secretion system membrane subunit TssM [Rosenbergiella australiborealis]
MELLSPVFRKIASRIIVTGVLLLLCYCIAQYGEFWGVGHAYPLSPLHCRGVVIVCLLLSALVFYYRLPRYLIVALGMGAVLWVMGPLLSVGEAKPLASLLVRSLLCLLLALVTVGYFLSALAVQAYGALPQKMASLPFAPRYHPPRYPELIRLFKTWRKKLRNVKGRGRVIKRLFWNDPASEAHCCVLMVGPTGSGKSSALASAELTFTLPAQQQAARNTVEKTEHCALWLTDDVLWCDTPGRFFDPQQPPEDRADEWSEVTKQLVAMRRVARVEAVVVVIDCPRLLFATPQQLTDYAALCRTQLRTLQQQANRVIPFYLFLSQGDKLEGFDDYFHGITAEQRQQLFGQAIAQNSSTHSLNSDDIHQQLTAWAKQVEQQVLTQQHYCDSVDTRKGIERFPTNFAALTEVLATFIEHLAPPPYERLPNSDLVLAGIYLGCSAYSRGQLYTYPHTLVQQWQKQPEALEDRERDGKAVRHSSQHFFLNTFFNHLLVGECRARQRAGTQRFSTRYCRGTALVLLTLVSALIFSALTRSYYANQGYLSQVADDVEQLGQQLSATPLTLDDALSRLRQISPPFTQAVGNTAFSSGHWGLYTPPYWMESRNAVYDQWLIDYLLPQLRREVAEELSAQSRRNEPYSLFTTLRVYLMLQGEIPRDNPFLITWFSAHATRLPVLNSQDNATTRLRHLLYQVNWPSIKPTVDQQRIKVARKVLNEQPLATYVYQDILQHVAPESLPTNGLSQLITSSQPLLFSEQGQTEPLAGLYTVFGAQYWTKTIQKTLFPNALARVEQTLYGEEQRGAGLVNKQQVWQQVSRRYLDDYRTFWQTFLQGIQFALPVEDGGAKRANLRQRVAYLLKDFTRQDSQLRQLLVNIAHQTQLATVQQKNGDLREEEPMLNNDRVQRVDQYFTTLHRFVEPPGTPSSFSLEQLERAFTQLYLSMQATPVTTDRQLSALVAGQPETASLQTFLLHLDQLPPPLPQLLGQLFSVAQRQVTQQTWATNAQQVEQAIITYCRQHLLGRYPFAKRGRDADPQAIVEMFAPQGKLSRYFSQHLADNVDTQHRPWRFTTAEPPLSPQLLAVFEQGDRIQQLLFPSSSSQPSLDFTLSVQELASGVTQLIVDNDNQQFRYVHGPIVQQAMHWPAQSLTPNLQIRALAAEGHLVWKIEEKGYWGLFRWFEGSHQQFEPRSQQTLISLGEGAQSATVAINGLGRSIPELIKLFRTFSCPISD